MSRPRTALVFVILASCSKPVVFQGTTPMTISAEPPPAVASKPPPRVEVRDNKIAINEKIQFEYDKATIMQVSHGLLNEVASVIKNNPHIKKIQIEGHASSEGDADHNMRLSHQRARAVMRYLVEQGIAQPMLVAKGFGIDRPIADNTSDAGREANRRVEFNIVEQDITQKKVEIDEAGNEKVIEEQTLGKDPPKAGAGG